MKRQRAEKIRRLSVEPLIARLPEEHRTDPGRYLNVGGSTWKRYVALGLNTDQADRLAVRIGLHPYDVWGDDFWADLPEWVFGNLRGAFQHDPHWAVAS